MKIGIYLIWFSLTCRCALSMREQTIRKKTQTNRDKVTKFFTLLLSMCNINVNTLNTFPISTFFFCSRTMCDSSEYFSSYAVRLYTADGLISTSLMIVVIFGTIYTCFPHASSTLAHKNTHTHMLTNTSR